MMKLGRRSGACAIASLVAVVLLGVTAPAHAATLVRGVGASFPLPLYQRWASDHGAKDRSMQVVYSGGGSGFGQSQIKAGLVDFAGSDQPLTKADLQDFGLVQFPTCVGGVVPIVNLKGIGPARLKLTGAVLAGIFLGSIRTWNAPAIKALNKGLALPAQKIVVVHRLDASGTTWIFTNYLARVSSVWASGVGVGVSVSWPRGTAGNGSPGVVAIVAAVPGAIGYVEYAYAKANRLAYPQLKNRAGNWVRPSVGTFAAAAASAQWTWNNGFYTVLVNEPGANSWPITGATWVLIKRKQVSQAYGRAMLHYFDWCYRSPTAQRDATSLDYVTMPVSVVAKVEAVWKQSVSGGGKPCWP
jgi:phosphate transport system substrate-binding protein